MRRRRRRVIRFRRLQDTDLLQEPDLVVEQLFFHDLALLPAGDGAELQLEGLPRRRMYLAIQPLPWTNQFLLPLGNWTRSVCEPET